MYELVRGPLVWIAFCGFVGGSLYKVLAMLAAARREKTVFPTFSARHGGRSVRHWIVPFANRNTRLHPVMTMVSFLFHVCLLLTPLLALGHAVLWQESWGVRWWSLPPLLADVMTLFVIFSCGFFVVRRLAAPEVRNVTTWSDIGLVLVVVAPFLTGFASHQQWLEGRTMLLLHIVSGAVWLVAIPFTRLRHMLWFFPSRAYMGSEFGAVRHARDW